MYKKQNCNKIWSIACCTTKEYGILFDVIGNMQV